MKTTPLLILLCATSVFSVSLWLTNSEAKSTTETQRTQRLHGENTALVADTIIFNAVIHTMDAANPTAEAVAIYANRIVAVGSSKEFQDNVKGTITIGKLADLVLLSRDIFKIDPKEIENVKVVLTIVDGHIVFSEL